MKPGKSLFLALLVPFLFLPTGLAQEDFEDELEAELEAELGGAEEIEEQEVSLEEEDSDDLDFGDEEEEEEAPKKSEKTAEKNDSDSEEDFSEDDFEEAFNDEDFNEDDFGEGEEDFADFEEELEDDLKGQEAVSDIPVEENLEEATQDLDLEPLDEEPVLEEVVEPSGPPIQETLEEQMAEEPMIEEPLMDDPGPAMPAPVEEVAGDIGPNLEYEARLYNIYVNYHNSPTSEDEWLSVVGARQSELYQIQQGDTLWGVSETFFGDGNFWPKVWSVNNRIENPHLISVGNQIQFVLGTESDAPMFTVTETPTEAPAQAEGGEAAAEQQQQFELDMETINELIESGALDAADAEQLKAAVRDGEPPTEVETPAEDPVDEQVAEVTQDFPEPDIEIPPPSIISRPVLKQLPPSVPEWQNLTTTEEYDDVGISYARRPIADLRG